MGVSHIALARLRAARAEAERKSIGRKWGHVPSTSRQRDRESAGEIERWRDRERQQGSGEQREEARLYDPRQLQQSMSPLTPVLWK